MITIPASVRVLLATKPVADRVETRSRFSDGVVDHLKRIAGRW